MRNLTAAVVSALATASGTIVSPVSSAQCEPGQWWESFSKQDLPAAGR
ncbi:hypothetical protein MBOT_35790 [Mycobacterium botniense]|uniref:Uncharacterized protein n=1 Tax=Mycobacterium botniense TaxID=84962 RepID=A0A7I9Y2F9_9MYCO|nr:hypothetical protein MBOT_35790 [Mycobacterium botniense]